MTEGSSSGSRQRATNNTRKPEVTRTISLQPSGCGATHATSSIVDPQTLCDRHSPRSISWSGPTEALFGHRLEDIENSERWWLDHIHPDDRSQVWNSLIDQLDPVPGNPYAASSRIWGCDYRLRHARGHYILVSDRGIITRDLRGNVMTVISFVLDMEKRRIERDEYEQLHNSQNHLAVIADNTPSGIFMMDPQGYTTYMNTAAEQITGFTFEEIRDYTFHSAIHSCRRNGEPYPLHECPVFRHQQDSTAAKNESEVFVHKDGHHYDIVYSVSPISFGGRNGSVIEFRDVTEEKRIERERLNALLMNEQQSTRIQESEVHKASMTSFVSFVCHELRNPLQGVTSGAEFLAETLDKLDSLTATLSTSPPMVDVQHGRRANNGVVEAPTLVAMQGLLTYAKELVSNIATCASHQALITNNVLDLSRLDAGKVEPSFDVVDVQALGKQAVGMMAARAHVKSIDLSMDNPSNAPLYVQADATILSQVLLNLISNAVKFTPENGKIVVDLYLDPPGRDGRVTLHGSVSDNGLGMTQVEQQRLFQRFSQANRKVAQLYGGSGLGLSISKELVQLMGGTMHVKSAQGKGSTFGFTTLHDVPTKGELLAFLRDSDAHVEGPDLESLSITHTPAMEVPQFGMICVAEDNPINLRHLAKNLDALGYKHVLCTNGQEALDVFRHTETPIDAVIIDMSMPVMDGLEATHRMREFERTHSLPRTPIIALSGNALKEQINAAMDVGTSDYLVKPCKRADLAKTLDHWEKIVHTGGSHKPMVTR